MAYYHSVQHTELELDASWTKLHSVSRDLSGTDRPTGLKRILIYSTCWCHSPIKQSNETNIYDNECFVELAVPSLECRSQPTAHHRWSMGTNNSWNELGRNWHAGHILLNIFKIVDGSFHSVHNSPWSALETLDIIEVWCLIKLQRDRYRQFPFNAIVVTSTRW